MKVSVIIPVYNVESYIRECLLSIMNQSYRDFEVILVDDCGSDRSLDVIYDLLSGKDEGDIDGIKYRIIHHECNRGLSVARNTGIKASVGEWLFFLDSDDFLTCDALEVLMSHTGLEDIDMVIGAYEFVGGNMSLPTMTEFKHNIVNSSDVNLVELYTGKQIYSMVWNKLIYRSFLLNNNLFFVEGLFHEDELWTFSCLSCAHKIAISNKVTYYYVIRDTSIQRNPDALFHNEQYSKVYLEMLNVMDVQQLNRNRVLYDFLFRKIVHVYSLPYWYGSPENSIYFFNKLRYCHYWSIIDLTLMRVSMLELFIPLILLLPASVGQRLFHKIVLMLSSRSNKKFCYQND